MVDVIMIMGDDVMVMECMPDYHQCWRSCISRDPPPLPPPSTIHPSLSSTRSTGMYHSTYSAHSVQYWGHPVSAKCTLPNTTHLHCTRMYITLFTLSTTWTPCTPTITWTPCTTTITWIPYTPTLTWTPCTLTRTWTPCTTSTTSALSVILQYTGMFCSILQYPIC